MSELIVCSNTFMPPQGISHLRSYPPQHYPGNVDDWCMICHKALVNKPQAQSFTFEFT